MNAHQTEPHQELVAGLTEIVDLAKHLAESAGQVAGHEETDDALVARFTRLELALGGMADVLEALQHEFGLTDPEVNDRHREVK